MRDEFLHTDLIDQVEESCFGAGTTQTVGTVGFGDCLEHLGNLLGFDEKISTLCRFGILAAEIEVEPPSMLFGCQSKEKIIAEKMAVCLGRCANGGIELAGDHPHPFRLTEKERLHFQD